jgi:hypothetical protein
VVNRLVARYGPGLVIVHGRAAGIDASFVQACDDLGVQQEPYPALWKDVNAPGAVIRRDRYGRQCNANAGPDRNVEMVAAGAEMCIAFHRFLMGSRGTKDCVRRAIAAGIPTCLIDSEKAEPRRLRAGMKVGVSSRELPARGDSSNDRPNPPDRADAAWNHRLQ